MDLEHHNYRQIEQLNQRGGRTLTVVDLIRAGTMSLPMAAYALRAMEQGVSLLTGARPGGAGKTTLMSAILHLLPPGVRIVTVDGRDRIADAEREPSCYLVHEIGDGHWYGYLWGPAVAEYFSLIQGPRRTASCLHADTLEELTAILTSPPLSVPQGALARVGLILFMHVDRMGQGYRRRVATFYEANGQGGHRLVFEWDAATDTFHQAGEIRDPVGLSRYTDFIQQMVDDDVPDAESVRGNVLDFYGHKGR
jgi:hypothetical protein